MDGAAVEKGDKTRRFIEAGGRMVADIDGESRGRRMGMGKVSAHERWRRVQAHGHVLKESGQGKLLPRHSDRGMSGREEVPRLYRARRVPGQAASGADEPAGRRDAPR